MPTKQILRDKTLTPQTRVEVQLLGVKWFAAMMLVTQLREVAVPFRYRSPRLCSLMRQVVLVGVEPYATILKTDVLSLLLEPDNTLRLSETRSA